MQSGYTNSVEMQIKCSGRWKTVKIGGAGRLAERGGGRSGLAWVAILRFSKYYFDTNYGK